MRTHVVVRHCGIVLLIISLLLILSAVTALLSPSDSSFVPLAVAGLLALICGLLPVLMTKSVDKIQAKEGYSIVLSAWITAWLFGAIPYMIYGGEFSVINALFESKIGRAHV